MWFPKPIVGFATIFLAFACVKNKASLESISKRVAQTPIAWGLLAAHCAAMLFVAKLFSLSSPVVDPVEAALLVVSCVVAGSAAIVFAGFAFLSKAVWAQLVAGTGYLWLYALIAAISARVAGNMSRWWLSAAGKRCKSPYIGPREGVTELVCPGVVVNSQTMILGTPRFSVEIAPWCSGIEGVGLILAFGVLWLVAFRRECRFPQSLVLLPLGAALIFVLNAVRIAALILIGDAGAPKSP